MFFYFILKFLQNAPDSADSKSAVEEDPKNKYDVVSQFTLLVRKGSIASISSVDFNGKGHIVIDRLLRSRYRHAESGNGLHQIL